ncbi:MAG TPA: hypothetical protein DEA67_06595 [Selenomonas sp.]|nr:hypothetical protein [Selenomonas sp.]
MAARAKYTDWPPPCNRFCQGEKGSARQAEARAWMIRNGSMRIMPFLIARNDRFLPHLSAAWNKCFLNFIDSNLPLISLPYYSIILVYGSKQSCRLFNTRAPKTRRNA